MLEPPIIHLISNSPDVIVELWTSNSPIIHRFFVSSWPLVHASPVFSRQLDTKNRFRSPSTVNHGGELFTLLEIEDDDPRAFEIVMHILHYNNKKLPQKGVSWDELKAIAVVWDKYTINSLLRPPWIEDWKGNMLHPGREDWVFIGRVFGVQENYAKLVSRLVLECSVEKKVKMGDKTNPYVLKIDGLPLKTDLWPDAVIEHIITERQRTVDAIYDKVIVTWRSNFGSNRPKTLCTCQGKSQYHRHAFMSDHIHAMMQQFVEVKDIKKAEEKTSLRWHETCSILELRRKFQDVRTTIIPGYFKEPNYYLSRVDYYGICPLEAAALRGLATLDNQLENVWGLNTACQKVQIPVHEITAEIIVDRRRWQKKISPKKVLQFLQKYNVVVSLVSVLVGLLGVIMSILILALK